MDVREALEVYDIRAFLDQLIGQLAATHGSDEQIQGLRGISMRVWIKPFEQMILKPITLRIWHFMKSS